MSMAFQNKWRRRYASAAALGRGLFGKWRYCVMCDKHVPTFLPWRGGRSGMPPLMRALESIGSDPDNFLCPRCRSTDRERHLKLYLERSGIANRFRGTRVLHFAPEANLAKWIAQLGPKEYVAGDLYPSKPHIRRMDLQSIPFGDQSFDVVIANHVLEHVSDVDRATSEIARVLSDEGIALLQTPWVRGLETTLDDPTVTDPFVRVQLYGQEDHVRLFGRDVYARIGAFALVATPLRHADLLGDIDALGMGVNPQEDLMLFRVARRQGQPIRRGSGSSCRPVTF